MVTSKLNKSIRGADGRRNAFLGVPKSGNWTRRLVALVYELYALTEEEIGVVEGRLKHE
jgi:hypothetical protein